MLHPCPSWLWACTSAEVRTPTWAAPAPSGAEAQVKALQLFPLASTAAPAGISLSQLDGVPVAGVSWCSCSTSHPPPACTAGSLGCVGVELLHCSSWELAKVVIMPTAEILTRPWACSGSLGFWSRGQEWHARTEGIGAPGCWQQQQQQ